jgi:hypothetical protein
VTLRDARGRRPPPRSCSPVARTCGSPTRPGAYQAAYGAGLRIPDHLSIVSFDDSDLAGWLRPELTSIALPHYELGRCAVRLLLADDRGTRTILVPMPVRERESSGRPPIGSRPAAGRSGRRRASGCRRPG